MTPEHDIALLRRTIRIAEQARADGNHPFGALLADASGAVLLEAGNQFAARRGPGHAETELAREAVLMFDPEALARTTLYTSVEPCAMCAGTTYWAGIGALVYGVSEKRLSQLTGDDEENLTMDMPCRMVFDAGRRRVEVRGPFPELEAEIVASHEGFWK
ncbi:MAG TPA: nucleoside deaminase [Devosiaceae bacterium]|nr:nucleoside deaminase [Devosiaceae bacterium]